MQRYNHDPRRVSYGGQHNMLPPRGPPPNFSRRTSQAYPPPQDQYIQGHQPQSNNQPWNNNRPNGFSGPADGAYLQQPPRPPYQPGPNDPDRVAQLNNLMYGAAGRTFNAGPQDRSVSLFSTASSQDPRYNGEPHPFNDMGDRNDDVSTSAKNPQDMVVARQNDLGADASDARDRLYGFHADNYPPFVDTTRPIYPSTLPVIRIENAPYDVSQSEISMWMAKHMFAVGNKEGSCVSYPIHILMERATAKSMDVWLELPTRTMADQVMARHNGHVANQSLFRISNRPVIFHRATQGELMKAIFPIAKGIHWDVDTGIPVMVKGERLRSNGEPVCAFRGFLSHEELYCNFEHAIHPNRVTTVDKCPQRGYEEMLATIVKYPWASTYYTVIERDTLFDFYFDMLKSMITKVWNKEYLRHKGREVGLSIPLARTFANAGLRCPGFSEHQKVMIVEAVGEYDEPIEMSHFSKVWPFTCLNIPLEVRDKDLASWMELFDLGCHKLVEQGEVATDRLRLHRNDKGFWFVVDKFAEETKRIAKTVDKQSGIKPLRFCDYAELESQMLKRIIRLGWESFFSARHIDYTPKEFSDLVLQSSIMKKMVELGCLEPGGIDRPESVSAGADIIMLKPSQAGTWHHLMTCTTSQIPATSATESLAEVDIDVDPDTEANFQEIQAVIHGHLPVDTVMVDMSLWAKSDMPQRVESISLRPGHGSWHPDVIAGRFDPYVSIESDSEPEDEEDHGVTFSTPRNPISVDRNKGSYSAPQSRLGIAVNFAQIARQAVATKSGENTPVRMTGSHTGTESPASSRRGSPKHVSLQGDSAEGPRAATPERGLFQNVTEGQIAEKAGNDPFIGAGPRSAEVAGAVFIAKRGGVRPLGAATDISPSRRARSASPNKNSYTLAEASPNQDFGPIGTPARRRTSVIVPEPTIHEANEEDLPTSGTAKSTTRGRTRQK